MEYIMKMKAIYDNLAVPGELVKDCDHALQLLDGLGPKYNVVVASLTTRDDDLSHHSVNNILLTHEQRLMVQNYVPLYLNSITTNMAMQT